MPDPMAETGLLIRRPAAEVFAAFTDPAQTTRFWFTKSSGPLAPAARVRWEWEMYGAGADVVVKTFEQDRRIVFDWGDPGDVSEVEWTFEPAGPDAVFMQVVNRDFSGDAGQRQDKAMDSLGGFSLVLAAAKVFLEHGVEPALIEDRFPDAVKSDWPGRT